MWAPIAWAADSLMASYPRLSTILRIDDTRPRMQHTTNATIDGITDTNRQTKTSTRETAGLIKDETWTWAVNDSMAPLKIDPVTLTSTYKIYTLHPAEAGTRNMSSAPLPPPCMYYIARP